jgi:UDP:flavonoid glycosyltransferase YjiC (YdhE family)
VRWPKVDKQRIAYDKRKAESTMRFVMSSYGTRGEVEPCVAVGRELLRRGHEVCLAVPRDLVAFVESAGLTAVAYKLDTQTEFEKYIQLWRYFYFSRNLWRVREVARLWLELGEVGSQCVAETSTTLMSLADGADLVLTGVNFEQPAAKVAEFYDLPLAVLHYSPIRANGQILPMLPSPLTRSAMTVLEWLVWRLTKSLEDGERRELGLPKTTTPYSRRMAERGSLEIQAYDEVCFPGLAAEWAQWNDQRPFVGTLTMELPADADEEVLSWIAAGAPPICFGLGSIPVESAANTLRMISGACAQLGERAVVCSGWSDFSDVPHFDHVKVVRAVNYAAIFPRCRAIVHQGTSATAAGLRAGVPTLILWTIRDQWILGDKVKRLKVGTARRLSATTEQTLVADLRTILGPQYVARAREIAGRMTKSAESVMTTADLVENFARSRRVG